MKKYLATAKILFKAQLIYRFDVILTALGNLWHVLFAWILWGALYEGRTVIGGMSFQAMLSYYIFSSFLSSIDLSWGVCGEVSGRIRGGTFSKYMVIPANPQISFCAQSLGASGYYALFSIIVSVLLTVVLRIRLIITADPLAMLCALVMIPMGLVFMISYYYFIGILTFKFEDVGFFMHMQGALLSFLTGGIIPLSLLPETLLNVVKFLPFTYVYYTPAMLITGRISGREGLFSLMVLLVWTAAMLLINHLTYERLRVKYDGVCI